MACSIQRITPFLWFDDQAEEAISFGEGRSHGEPRTELGAIVTAEGNVAFSHALMRFTGRLTSGRPVDMWLRSTMGWVRRDGRWMLVHEHLSDPMDPETGRTRIDLQP